MSEYTDRLLATKKRYPFARWIANTIEDYNELSCQPYIVAFDTLLDHLVALGEQASTEAKLEAFQETVETLNDLNDNDGLIETGEREDLCEICNIIAIAAGIDPTKYGGGEGPASEWRDW
ncbi:hypothetical protein [Pseudanabaena sp. BC1403]|jgi:hypothetical protein|uniref:hypothetical protein n=1 Tax=Pseudanabaena sp. BC1403 TaxID=2043171 RepID=UPI000CD9A9E4|nr:hypothetical protein [Pseudanabaena sp. BC1403]